MWDEDLLRSLALVQARLRAIERKKEIFSDLGDMQAFNGLKADLENYISSSASAGLIPGNPLGNVSNRLKDLAGFFAAAQTIYDEVLQTGAETLNEGVPPVSLERLRDLPNQISAWRQVLSSKVSACQSQINSLDWMGAIGQADIHQELFHCAKLMGGKLPKDSARRINLCCFVFGTGPLWDSSLDHLNQVEKRVQELIPLHEQHRVAVENANTHGRFGDYRSANQILTEVGIDYSNPDKPCSKFSDIDYGEVLTLLGQMHEAAETMDALCSDQIPAETKELNDNLKKSSGSFWWKKSAQAVDESRISLKKVQERWEGYRRYVGAFPNSELQQNYENVLAQGDNLISSAYQEFESITQKGQRLGKIKRRASFAGATLLSLLVAAFFIHNHLTEKTGVQFSTSVGDGPPLPPRGYGFIHMTIEGKSLHEEFEVLYRHGSREFTLPSGEYQLKTKASVFRPFSKKFEVKYGKRANLGTIELIPVHGALEVITDPPGAIVFNSSGQKVGLTPFAEEKVSPGQKIFRVTHPQLGYADLKGKVEDDKQLTLSYRFARANIDIKSDPSGLDVIGANNLVIGKTPLSIKDLKEGEYAYRLSAGILGSKDFQVKIKDRQNVALSHSFPRANAHLYSGIPGSAVILSGGKALPLPWQGELPPGFNFFHAFKPGYIERKVCYGFIKEGITNKVYVPFYKPGTLHFWDDGQVAASLANIISVESFDENAIALSSTGDVLSVFAYSNKVRPTLKLRGARMIAATDDHQIAILNDGKLVCWEGRPEGGVFEPAKDEKELKGLKNIIAITASQGQVLGLNKLGNLGIWRLGGLARLAPPPRSISGKVVAIAAGYDHYIALLRDGTVAAWGANFQGQCNVPKGLNGVISIAAGSNHSLALTVNGKVIAWGDNTKGQTNVPPLLANVVAIHANPDSKWSFATLRNGQIATWGRGDIGASETAMIPASVIGKTFKIEAGRYNNWIYSLSPGQ